MKLSGKNICLVLITSLVILLLSGSILTYLSIRFFNLDDYKEKILSELQKTIHRQVLYEKGDFSLRYGPSFTFTKVVIKEKDGAGVFVRADRLIFKLSMLPLLEKRVELREMAFDRPVITLSRDRSGVLNISDLLEEKKEAIPLRIKGISLKKGIIGFTDLAVLPEGIITSLDNADLVISHLVRGSKCDFKLSATLVGTGKHGTIKITGSARLAPVGKSLDETRLQADLAVKNLDAGRYWPYYSRYVPFTKVFGLVDLDSDFNGKLREFTSRGKVRISGLHFNYPQVFHSVLTPRDLGFSYDMELTPQDVLVKGLDLTVDGLNVKGSCLLRDIHTNDPRITAKAVTSSFNLEHFAHYIPYGIIVKDTADFIEQHIKGGIYRLDDGRLDGRVSQILHMEQGDNYNVLAINGRVEKGLLTFGPEVPTFNGIRGDLEMRGKDFNLRRISGNFGGSPFTLEGKITDYPLNKPSGYPFTMRMTPRQPETAWLLGKEKGQKFTLSGDSTLHLTGDGYTSGYNLSGEWDLTPAAYSYPDLINKPAGRSNSLNFRGLLTKDEARLASLNYNLAPMSLAVSAGYRFTDKPHLKVEIRSNRFQVNEVAQLFPAVKTYRPSGIFQAAVSGDARSGDPADMGWEGSVSFSGVAFKPPEPIKSVSNVTGAIRFHGNTLETSQLAARLGNSTIYGTGSLAGFDNPTLNLTFSSPVFDMADLGLRAPKGEVRASNVQGSVYLKDNNLLIKSLAGHINKSVINLKGNVQDLRSPKIDLSVTSPNLELSDIMLLTELKPVTGKSEQPGRLTLKATVAAETGKIRNIPFEKLAGTFLYEERILYLQSVELQALGGRVAGRGRIDFGTGGSPRYQVGFNLTNVAAERLTGVMGMKKQEITGTLSMQGELSGKGETADEFKRTALGSVKFRIEDGSLQRFAILSKIFSILNVSQLLKFQFPDMVSGGMPFNKITATLEVREGVVFTNNLFVKSDAINLSAIGKADTTRDELDVTIGVQPLQTVDKVVSRIPIVGWILTGKNHSLVTAYFEARGKLADPSVTAVPVKSMAKGIFNIFKRVFELPAKLFTDTGEVLTGK
ncbi:MAG: AsmA-like C-terminal domain-containing protein [Geobacteraceae bacterium]